MIHINKGVEPDEIKQNSRHVLFVEGRGNDSVDPKILEELFDGMIRIEPLGASFSIKSVAEALYPFHPTYYFLIDRDHHDDDFINRCWENFPDKRTHNLLVWRHREIENYFLEPDYLGNSDYLNVSELVLKSKIKRFCQERLYLDAANQVIVSIREEFKRKWISKFTNPAEFQTREQAIDRLLKVNEFNIFKKKVDVNVNLRNVERRFDQVLKKMTGGYKSLKLGTGKWIEMIQGKKVLAKILHSECFKVTDLQGNYLQ